MDDQQNEYLLKTPLKVLASEWDEIKGRPKNIYEKNYKKLNSKLDRIKIAVADYVREKNVKRQHISKIVLLRIIKRYSANTEIQYREGTLLKYMEFYIEIRLHIISKPTHMRYMVFFRLLERFEGYRLKHLYLQEINASFVKEFINFGEIEEYSKSTVYRTINFVKTILNFLEKRGVRTFVYELEFPKNKQSNSLVTLTEDELIIIKRVDVPLHLKAAKDWLIFSCYVGQRISDFMNFKTDMLEVIDGRTCMSFKQKKTKKDILLPLHPVALNVMAENNEAFPIRLSNQKYNEQIKEVAQLAGIKNLVKVRIRNGYRAEEMMVQKWQAITSHVGRRSFATNFYGKIPTPLLMEATGHSTEKMFNRYISSSNTERIHALGTHLNKAYKEKYLNEEELLPDSSK